MSASGQGRTPEQGGDPSALAPSARSSKSTPQHPGSQRQNPDAPTTHDEGSSSGESSEAEAEFRPKRSRSDLRLTEDEYVMVAKDIMGKPPFSGYLKYHLPLKYAARCEEVRWQWQDSQGKMYYKELIGGGRNSDLEYD